MLDRFRIAGLVWVMSVAFCISGRGEDAAGIVAKTGYGNFLLDDNGTLRQFLLSGGRDGSQFDPDSWRPARGDKVAVSFHLNENKLVVDQATLAEAGPLTPTGLASPIEVEIVKAGRSGVRVRIASGHTLLFLFDRELQRIPSGWMPLAGEKAIISYRVERGGPFGPGRFGVNYVAERLEKTP